MTEESNEENNFTSFLYQSPLAALYATNHPVGGVGLPLEPPGERMLSLQAVLQMSNEEAAMPNGKIEYRFPFKLYDMLQHAVDKGFEDVVSWLPCGTMFKIHNQKKFEAEVMPDYFPSMTCYKSFRRQLNLYGIIQRETNQQAQQEKRQAGGSGAYSHPFLIRCNRQFCSMIHRQHKHPQQHPSQQPTHSQSSLRCFSARNATTEDMPWASDGTKNREQEGDIGDDNVLADYYQQMDEPQLYTELLQVTLQQPENVVLNVRSDISYDAIHKKPSFCLQDQNVKEPTSTTETASILLDATSSNNQKNIFACANVPPTIEFASLEEGGNEKSTSIMDGEKHEAFYFLQQSRNASNTTLRGNGVMETKHAGTDCAVKNHNVAVIVTGSEYKPSQEDIKDEIIRTFLAPF